MLRLGRRCAPTYQAIRRAVRDSPWVVPDETGWRVGGGGAWLHTHVAADATCYVVDPTRSGDVLAEVIGWDYAGVLIHDGWAPYDNFTRAGHQQCLAHLLRRTEELLLTATQGAVRFPRALLAWFGAALRLRDRHAAGKVSAPNLVRSTRRLQRQLEQLVGPTKQHAANERLAAFLWRHRYALLTFLRRTGIDATNWRAEQATRPAVVNRKVWGGNRTWAGAKAQARLMSVFRTCWQRGHDILTLVQHLLCSPKPLALLPGG
jgi:transposase